MFVSPVPLLLIRADVASLIEVNGQFLGECREDSFLALPVSDSGDYYVSASPLAALRYPVTRRLQLAEGQLLSAAPDVSLCAWPGGVYEMCLFTGRFVPEKPQIPEMLDRLQHGGRSYILFRDGGVRLSVEEEGRPLAAFTLGEGSSGALSLVTAFNEEFVAVRREESHLILLDDKLNSVLELSADLVTDRPAAIFRLGTCMGHEKRILYRFSGGSFSAEPAETGFFTHDYVYPKDRLALSTALCEAVREGFLEEALSYLTPALRETLNFTMLQEFFGAFDTVRPPFSDLSGGVLGLIAAEGELLQSARLFSFEFEGDRISNIREE